MVQPAPLITRFQQGIATDEGATVVVDNSILIPCWVARAGILRKFEAAGNPVHTTRAFLNRS